MGSVGELPQVEIVRGESYTELLTFQYRGEGDVVLPYPLTVFEDIIMDVRRKARVDSDLVFTLSLGQGLSIVGDDNHQLLIVMSHTDTKKFNPDYSNFPLPAGSFPSTRLYYRDIMFVQGGEVFPLLKGTFKIIHNVTDV